MIEQLHQKYRETCGLAEVAKREEGRQGAAVNKCMKYFFLKWPKYVFHAWLIPILSNFFVCENDIQSWNSCFLGVCSANQLPKASWLGKLTMQYRAIPFHAISCPCNVWRLEQRFSCLHPRRSWSRDQVKEYNWGHFMKTTKKKEKTLLWVYRCNFYWHHHHRVIKRNHLCHIISMTIQDFDFNSVESFRSTYKSVLNELIFFAITL